MDTIASSSPPCPHFNVCGGCSLQHLDTESYYRVKQELLTKVMTSLGVDMSVVTPIVRVGDHSRRRVEFKVSVQKGAVSIGFYDSKSHQVFDLDVCLVCDERLTTLIPTLKSCVQNLKKPGAVKAIALTVLNNGLDGTLTCRLPLHAADQEALIACAKKHQFVRLSLKDENDSSVIQTIYKGGEPTVNFGNYEVALPAGAFLQATGLGEFAITELVTTHLKGCEQVADLYSGCGTYSFALIETVRRISAFEGAEEMVSAMHNAILHYGLETRMKVSVRDLFKRPMATRELQHFDGVVINPPRNGALPQVQQIAASEVKTVVMVSCNPATFKRDAQCLLDNGYTVKTATAIDQFYWSNHLEVVAVFVRA